MDPKGFHDVLRFSIFLFGSVESFDGLPSWNDPSTVITFLDWDTPDLTFEPANYTSEDDSWHNVKNETYKEKHDST